MFFGIKILFFEAKIIKVEKITKKNVFFQRSDNYF